MLAIVLDVAVRRSDMKPSSINSAKEKKRNKNIYQENKHKKVSFLVEQKKNNLLSSSPKQQIKVSSLSSSTTITRNKNKRFSEKVEDDETYEWRVLTVLRRQMERSTIKETRTKTVKTRATDQVGDKAKDLSFDSASFSSPSPIGFFFATKQLSKN